MIMGAVGQLQFETVAHRLLTEYNIDATFESVPVHKALWVSSEDIHQLKRFTQTSAERLAYDAAGALAFMPPTRAALDITIERWPELTFHTTREISAF